MGKYVSLDLPSAPALTRGLLQALGARLHPTQGGLFGGKALLESANTSSLLTVAVPHGQVTPAPFLP